MDGADRDQAAPDVVVIGGGIAGLSAAYELQRRGRRALVFEAAERPGGVIRSERTDGWVIDAGPDAFLAQKPGAIALCGDLGLTGRLVRTLEPRTAFVLRAGRLYPLAEGSYLGFPVRVGALARSSLFSVPGRLRMAAEAFVRRGGGGDESVAAFVRRRFGEEAVTYLAEPLLAGIHAGDVERLSMQALFPRLLEAEQRHGSIIRAARRLGMAPPPDGAFVSLPGGAGELVDRLVEALEPGTVRLSSPVTALRRGRLFIVESPIRPVTARAVVLAVPAYAAAALLRGVDTSLAALCDGVPYASTATVAFGFRREQVAHPLRGTGFVVPRVERLALLAGTWVSSKWPGRAPEGHVLLRAFLGGGRDPRRLDQPDRTLVDTARRELSVLLGITGDPLFARLFRWTRLSPQYEVGHLDRLRTIDDRLRAVPGLFVAGSGFRAIGVPDCISDGRETAARVAEYLR